MGIELDRDEQYIVDLINKACEKAPQSPQARISGGWVRDKLLGLESNDIDVMLDNMTGKEFAKYIGGDTSVAIVQENPERSKHLEVAICTISLPSGEKMKVEIVHARKEIYKEDSRIPIVKPASFEADAYRRDLTINALFYNLQTGEIEDPTGLAMDDLKNGIIRAPGDPKIRYLEDPLRVFRTIRFAARLGFTISDETWDALLDKEVQREVFEAHGGEGIFKLARERIGEEFLKIAEGSNSAYAMQLLKNSGMLEKMLHEAVVGTEYEGKLSGFDLDQQSSHHDFTVWDHTQQVIKNIEQVYDPGDSRRAMAVLSALFHDVGKLYGPIREEKSDGHISYIGHEDVSSDIADIFLNHFKMHRKLEAVEGQEKIPELVELVKELTVLHMRPFGLMDSKKRSINRFLRRLEGTGLTWRDVINMAYSDVKAKSYDESKYVQDVSALQELEKTIEKVINENAQMNVQLSRSILDGNEIMELFHRNDSGPWIGEVMSFLQEHQLDGLVEKDEARQMALIEFPQYVQNNIKMASKIQRDSVWDKVNEIVDDSPFEALRIAEHYFNEVCEDKQMESGMFGYERAVTLFIKAAVLASLKSGKSMMNEKVVTLSQQIAKSRIYNPELICLAICVDLIRNNPLDENDLEKLSMAHKMSPDIVSRYLSQALEVADATSKKKVLKVVI